MGTLISLFNLSRNTLLADQAALNVTAANVANQNTPGYTRQVATWSAGDTVALSGGGQSVAAPTLRTTSQRDRVLEQRVQQGTQMQAGTGARAAVLAQVEQVFSISGDAATAGSTQIGAALDGFFASLTTLTGAAGDRTSREGVLAAAGALAGTFNAAAAQLGEVGAGINASLKSSVTAVNGLTATIASLNREIGSNSPNADAGALEDQRQAAIAKLSTYVGLDQIQTEGNGISLTTPGGTPLVLGGTAATLSAVVVGGATEIRDGSGTDVSGLIAGGSVGGELEAQNRDLPGVRGGLDAVAYRVATAVNAQNAAGTTTAGTAGGAIFAVTAGVTGAAAAFEVIATSAAAVAAAGPGEGVSGNTNALLLAGIAGARDAGGGTIAEGFAAVLAGVGTASAGAAERNSAQTATLTQLRTQRDSLSAVSLDEEAANLAQYQRSYNAAAKVFQIVDSLMAAAINLGQATTVV